MSAGDAVRRLVADLELPGTLAAVGADDALAKSVNMRWRIRWCWLIMLHHHAARCV